MRLKLPNGSNLISGAELHVLEQQLMQGGSRSVALRSSGTCVAGGVGACGMRNLSVLKPPIQIGNGWEVPMVGNGPVSLVCVPTLSPEATSAWCSQQHIHRPRPAPPNGL